MLVLPANSLPGSRLIGTWCFVGSGYYDSPMIEIVSWATEDMPKQF
jgi:hypothetical protein